MGWVNGIHEKPPLTPKQRKAWYKKKRAKKARKKLRREMNFKKNKTKWIQEPRR